MQRRRYKTRLEYFCNLDKTDGPGSTLSVTYVCLYRAESTQLLFSSTGAKGLGKRCYFDRIAQLGRRTMRLNITNVICRETRICQGKSNNLRLTFHARCR